MKPLTKPKKKQKYIGLWKGGKDGFGSVWRACAPTLLLKKRTRSRGFRGPLP
jgi:hypothetical protein